MKKIQTLAILIAMLMPYCGFAQYDLKYLPCSNCSGNYTPVSFKINSSTIDLTSDYGKRLGIGISSWHRGIDLVASSYSNSFGFHLLSPFNATISQIYGSGQYYAIVLDGPGENNLGFGHIFEDGILPRVVGDMVLMKQDNNYIILDKTTGKAWCSIPGISVNFQGSIYITSNQVNAGERIAPIGNSGGSNVHVHVYKHLNPYAGVQDPANCKDPLKILNHMPSSLKIGMGQAWHLKTQFNPVFYAGDQASSIQFACQMLGNSFSPDNTLSSFQHKMMAIDHVKFFFGPDDVLEAPAGWGTVNSKFKMLKGPHYEGRISQGSLTNTTIYPSGLTDDAIYGSTTNTGIMPYAYSTGDYDNYFFSDFYQRLHVSCLPGSAVLQFARCNAEAMYPDGKYRIHARAETIEGLAFGTDQLQSQVIHIDNFLPYVQKVKAMKVSNAVPFYSGEWQWSGGSLNLSYPVNNSGSGGSDVAVVVNTSEPMEWMSMTYDAYASGQITVCEPGSKGKEWRFVIPATYLQSGTEFLSIEGKDLAGNSLQVLNPSGTVTSVQIPYRTGNTSWSGSLNCGPDKIHSISLGELTPPVAAFTPEEITVNPGTYVNFYDASIGDVQQWEWSFVGTLFSASSQQNPVVYYDIPGDYPVSLSVSNAMGSSVANGIVHVVEGALAPICNFSPQDVIVAGGTTIYFNDLSIGQPDHWQWDFDGVAPPSVIPDPDVEFWQSGTYQIKLTVANAVGSASCASTVTVVPQLPALVIMCHVTPFFGTTGLSCSFSTDILFGTAPYQLSFNFGDGTVVPASSNGGTASVSHQYLTSGIFNLVVGVTDANGLYQVCYESVTVIPADPCEGMSLVLKANGSEYMAALDVSDAHVFSAVVSGGHSPYLYVWNFYPDPVTGLSPNMTSNYQAGPHLVSFPAPGNYKVKLMVNDFNGCVKTIVRNYAVFQPEHCMYAKIQKKHEGELLVPLGDNCFYDFSEVLGSVSCADPPGSMEVPCITDSRWELRTYPAGSLIGVKNCHPFSQPECTMGFVYERLFTWNFMQSGLYRLKLKIWDNECFVQNGYDCEDQSEVQLRVVDCDNSIYANPDLPSPQQGINPDVYGGTIISGLGSSYFLAGGQQMNWYATKEIQLSSESHFTAGSEFSALIIPCPETFCGKSDGFLQGPAMLPEVEVYPNPGRDLFAIRIKTGDENMQRIEVYTILGAKIRTQECAGSRQSYIDLSDQSPGIYLLKVKLDMAEKIVKLSKQ